MLVVREGTSASPRQLENARRLMQVLSEEEKAQLCELLFHWRPVSDEGRRLAKEMIARKGFPRDTVRGLYDRRE